MSGVLVFFFDAVSVRTSPARFVPRLGPAVLETSWEQARASQISQTISARLI